MSKTAFTVARQIGIDAGHRIMTHGSKCRHLHGHRYTIEAVCAARNHLHGSGEQTDMVVDFGFLKEEMTRHIDAPCDHGLILSLADRDMLAMFCPSGDFQQWLVELATQIEADGYVATHNTRLEQKLYVIPFQPTAECLAKHWFERLQHAVHVRSDGIAELREVIVWETPNCRASYGQQRDI